MTDTNVSAAVDRVRQRMASNRLHDEFVDDLRTILDEREELLREIRAPEDAMEADEELSSRALREYLCANMFDGIDEGVTTIRTAQLLDDVVALVGDWRRSRVSAASGDAVTRRPTPP